MGESLRSGHGPFFQRLFAKKSTPTPVRGPLGLHLKAGFTLDTLAFRLLEDNLLIELPGEAYTIAATGQIDLGAAAGFIVTTPAAMSFCKLILLVGRMSMISMILSSLSMSKAMVSARKNTGVRQSAQRVLVPRHLAGASSVGSVFLTAASQGT